MNDGTPLTLGRSFWAIDPLVLPALVEAHRGHEALAGYAARFGTEAPQASEVKPDDRPGGAVAVIPLSGILTPRASLLSLLFGGGGGLSEFRSQFQAAVESPDIGSIVLDVDSPGGVIDLIPETAEQVREARGSKPITAVVNTMAASAAYWIASQADEIVITPSGSAGSIGVYMVHADHSKQNEDRGVAYTYISAGKYKLEGNPDSPLSKEAREDWQDHALDLYGMFVDAVAAGRNVSATEVRQGYGEGRTASSSKAVALGLADRVGTVENTIGEMLVAGSRTAHVTVSLKDVNVLDRFPATHVPFCNTLCDDESHFLPEELKDEARCTVLTDQGHQCLRTEGHGDDHAFRVTDPEPSVEDDNTDKLSPFVFAFDD